MLVTSGACGLADELPPNGRWGPCRDVIATGPIRQVEVRTWRGAERHSGEYWTGGVRVELNVPSSLFCQLDVIL